ncbi:MAG: hypothetical protein ACI9F9_001360 [Candidatus Paceibacteria bacterium]|jgi:hypothetical protein
MDLNRLPRLGVTSDSGLAWFHLESAKTTQCDRLIVDQTLPNTRKNGIYKPCGL